MHLAHKIVKWEQGRHDIFVLILRAFAGIIITIKGIFFLSHLGYLDTVLQHNSSLHRFAESFWGWYIALTSIFCGIFLIDGLFTKVVTLIQLPVLIGAVIFINPGENGFSLNGEFLLSLIVLGLLIYFLIKGPGRISMDSYLHEHGI